MDNDNDSSWFGVSFLYRYYGVKGDSCHLEDDKQQRSDIEWDIEFYFYEESCCGNCCDVSGYCSCFLVVWSLCWNGILRKVGD